MSSPTFAALVLLALFIGRWQRLGNQGPQVAVAALFAYQSMIVVPTWHASFVKLDEIRECLSPELPRARRPTRRCTRTRGASSKTSPTPSANSPSWPTEVDELQAHR